VQPESSVNVSPKTSGVLKQLLVKEGDFVKPGQIVAYMDNSNLQGQLLQARGNVAAAQANLNKVVAGNRAQDIAGATANLKKVQAIAQRNIDDAVIRAPFAGIIARKYADPGAFVTPTTAGSAVTSATSSSILDLASTNEIVAQVAEASIAQIRVGQVAMIKVDAYSGKTFEGKVTQVATQSLVQQNVTSFEVKVAVADSQRMLHQGMNVTIDFQAGELKQVLIVPTASIVQQKSVQGVFIAKTGSDPVFMPIVVGTTVNDKTEVKSGLTGNERVLLSFPAGTRKASGITDGGGQ
jgi:HlyD family secretion protein